MQTLKDIAVLRQACSCGAGMCATQWGPSAPGSSCDALCKQSNDMVCAQAGEAQSRVAIWAQSGLLTSPQAHCRGVLLFGYSPFNTPGGLKFRLFAQNVLMWSVLAW